MSQINKIIRELWRATYKGNDIDYIEIKTDDYDATAGADKRQVCNYRVIMVKQCFLIDHDVINQ
jgi:DNA repair protein RAD50